MFAVPPGLEGVDPSFLEALPESIRREVIAEQLRLARIQSQVRENNAAALASTTTVASSVPTTSAAGTSSQAEVATGGSGSLADVSAEFLAALPPAIQEEVGCYYVHYFLFMLKPLTSKKALKMPQFQL